tara:strand:- start:203 stop:1342 length:1140 start_codon:yes stop_codon:yes gene_type:complete
MLGVAVGTMALVVVMSAFNGLEDLVESLYSSFDADIRIEAKEGKYISTDEELFTSIKDLENVAYGSNVLEETVLLKYQEAQVFATIKGVEEPFKKMSGLDSLIWTGTSTLTTHDNRSFLLLGYLVAKNLNVNIADVFKPIQVYAANPNQNLAVSLDGAFFNEPIYPSGIFSVNAEFDAKYAVAPISFVQKLTQHENQITAWEFKAKPDVSLDALKAQIQPLVGDQYQVKTRFELNELLYKTNNSEKWATFLILSFILVIATFNILGSLTMLILDKKDDIYTLRSMGASSSLLKRIFFGEGMMITLIGGSIGMTLGLILCWMQTTFKMVTLQGMLIDYYPISVEFLDLLIIAGVVVFIGIVAATVPAQVVIRKQLNQTKA